MSVRVVAATAMFALASTAIVPAAGTLDYDFYKAKVQPIFLAKRPGHAPCVMCHADATNMLRLEKLPDGQSTWTEEQTRKNFDTVAKIVQAADDPLASKILLHPLAPEAGGDAFHSGGRQFASKNDPNWKTIAQWAQGATLAPGEEVTLLGTPLPPPLRGGGNGMPPDFVPLHPGYACHDANARSTAAMAWIVVVSNSGTALSS